ncbi:unnamed protein product [Ambrosiozyma monospora]|uniref:Unnamed protein product n=1 Tax=Ambrosiozyma monospora TaxID=43982 RepID=A0ACB5SS64_AMBMO|nr:unnamed protein product [Ambrosiozyma monospora]
MGKSNLLKLTILVMTLSDDMKLIEWKPKTLTLSQHSRNWNIDDDHRNPNKIGPKSQATHYNEVIDILK